MHGEQGALLCTARIVETVPWIDAKYYAATQVVDEARHVEVFARYLDDKLGTQYGINENLKGILDDILSDPRWDIAYLGMQIMVEGLALAAFGLMQQITSEPLLKKLLRYVMSDEARHVAFGVSFVAGVLQRAYRVQSCASARSSRSTLPVGCSGASRTPRCGRAWASIPTRSTARWSRSTRPRSRSSSSCCSRRSCRTARSSACSTRADGWLRERFTEIGVIQFEDWADTGDEYGDMDEVEKDRAAAGA